MKPIHFILALSLLLYMPARARDIEPLLRKLDAAIANQSTYILEKESRIDSLRSALILADTPREKWEAEMALHAQMSSYNLDSALAHIKKAETIARALNDTSLVLDALTNRAFLYNTSGVMHKEAYDIFRALPRHRLDSAMLFDYYCLGVQVYRNLAIHSIDSDLKSAYTAAKTAYRDSAIMLDPGNDVLLANRYIDQGNFHAALLALGPSTPDTLVSRDAAVKYNVMAQIYEQQGNRDMWRKYLTLSAICDITNGVREYLSLQALAKMLYEDGDYNRAYRYIHHSIADATACNAKMRMLEMSESLPIIDSAYEDMQRSARRNLSITCVIIGLLVIILGISLIYARKRNIRLAEANAEQKRLNERLHQSDTIKEEYIKRFMNLCLEYLAKMERYRNELNRVAARRDFDALVDTIKSTRYINKEVSDFYEKFDEAFLSLFPNFVADFNKLLRPGEEIAIRKGEGLNTELRIYALLRLGVSDSESVCRFLRCSASTVYNYRTKMRNRAVDRDKFEAEILNL